MYADYMAARLCFPILKLLLWLMDYNLGLMQLVSNVIQLVIVFVVRVSFPIVNVVKYCYLLKAGSNREKGWYYFIA